MVAAFASCIRCARRLTACAARLAAQRVLSGEASQAERSDAEEALAAGTRLGPDAAIAHLIAGDVAFHSAIHCLSGNRAVIETVADQWPHFRRSMGLVLSSSGAQARFWTEHAAILEAILAGNAAEAEALARRHTAGAGEATAQYLDANQQHAHATNGGRQ